MLLLPPTRLLKLVTLHRKRQRPQSISFHDKEKPFLWDLDQLDAGDKSRALRKVPLWQLRNFCFAHRETPLLSTPPSPPPLPALHLSAIYPCGCNQTTPVVLLAVFDFSKESGWSPAGQIPEIYSSDAVASMAAL